MHARGRLQGSLGFGGGGIGGIAVVPEAVPSPLLLSGGGIGGGIGGIAVVLPVLVLVLVLVLVSVSPVLVPGPSIGGISLSLPGPGIGGSLLWPVVVGVAVAVAPVVPVVPVSLPVVIGGVIGTAVAALSPFLSSPHAAAPRAANISTRRTNAGPPGGGVGRGVSSSRWTMGSWDAPASPLSSAHAARSAGRSSSSRLWSLSAPRSPENRNSSAEGARLRQSGSQWRPCGSANQPRSVSS